MRTNLQIPWTNHTSKNSINGDIWDLKKVCIFVRLNPKVNEKMDPGAHLRNSEF